MLILPKGVPCSVAGDKDAAGCDVLPHTVLLLVGVALAAC